MKKIFFLLVRILPVHKMQRGLNLNHLQTNRSSCFNKFQLKNLRYKVLRFIYLYLSVASQQFSSHCVCQPHMFSAVESFLFISSSGFSCFCHRVYSRSVKPKKVLIIKRFQVLRLYLILSTFRSIPYAQGTTLIN